MTTANPNWDPWNYAPASGYPAEGVDLVGFHVEATDGGIGKIDEATHDVGASYVVVDTGPWIFGTRVMLPAGVIGQVDVANEKVHLNRTKDQIKNAPPYDTGMRDDPNYRDGLGGYYGGPGFF
ncbi:PRC-barrel domain containing protein [Longispora sp. NPDC051575]|uniref:PRC-barrel domain containing protein n=1 Tax=Longispora sp. NPDC051575 TaxID=3154943 RepID=UPI003411FDDE